MTVKSIFKETIAMEGSKYKLCLIFTIYLQGDVMIRTRKGNNVLIKRQWLKDFSTSSMRRSSWKFDDRSETAENDNTRISWISDSYQLIVLNCQIYRQDNAIITLTFVHTSEKNVPLPNGIFLDMILIVRSRILTDNKYQHN